MMLQRKNDLTVQDISSSASVTGMKWYLISFLCGALPFLLASALTVLRNNGIFYYFADFNIQQIPFTYNISRNIGNMYYPQFDFNAGTGLDYINAYSFYELFSPFMFISALIPDKAFLSAMPVIIAVKFGFCSLFAYMYTARFCKTKEFALTGALLYTYSGFVLNTLMLNYLDALAFFPFLLFALEAAVQEKRRGIFGAAVFICAMTQYYIFGIEAVFLVIYFLTGLIGKNFRISIKDFFCLAAETILGLLAAGIVLVPAVIYMLDNPRAGGSFGSIKNMLLYENPWRYPKILQSIFMFPDMSGYMNFFPDIGAEYPFGSKWSFQGLYIPMFGISGVTAFMCANKKSLFSRLCVICGIIALIPVLNSIFSIGSPIYYARWMFAPTLIMSVMTACALENDIKYFKAGAAVQAAGISLIVIFGAIFPIEKIADISDKYLVYDDLNKTIVEILSAAGLAAVLILIFRFAGKRHYKKALVIITASFAFIGTTTMMFFGVKDFDYSRVLSPYSKGSAKFPAIEYTEYGSRVITGTSEYNHNLLWGKGSSYCFTSIYDPYVSEYCYAVGTIPHDLDEHYPSQCLLSAKEMVVDPDDIYNAEVIKNGQYSKDPRLANDTDMYMIYENKNFIPMGFCYDYCISKEDFLALDENIRDSFALKAMIVDDVSEVSDYLEPVPEEEIHILTDSEFAEECSKRAERSAYSYFTDSDSYNAEIELDEPELVFFSVAYSRSFTAYVDGEEAPLYNANIGFQAIPVPAGKHTIKCVYHSKERDIGAVCSIAGIAGLIVYTVIFIIIKRKDRVAADIDNV